MSFLLLGIAVAAPFIIVQFFIVRKVFKRYNDQKKKD